jgi:hypothetical protein
MYIHFTLTSDDGLNSHMTKETWIRKWEQLQSFILYLFFTGFNIATLGLRKSDISNEAIKKKIEKFTEQVAAPDNSIAYNSIESWHAHPNNVKEKKTKNEPIYSIEYK